MQRGVWVSVYGTSPESHTTTSEILEGVRLLASGTLNPKEYYHRGSIYMYLI